MKLLILFIVALVIISGCYMIRERHPSNAAEGWTHGRLHKMFLRDSFYCESVKYEIFSCKNQGCSYSDTFPKLKYHK